VIPQLSIIADKVLLLSHFAKIEEKNEVLAQRM